MIQLKHRQTVSPSLSPRIKKTWTPARLVCNLYASLFQIRARFPRICMECKFYPAVSRHFRPIHFSAPDPPTQPSRPIEPIADCSPTRPFLLHIFIILFMPLVKSHRPAWQAVSWGGKKRQALESIVRRAWNCYSSSSSSISLIAHRPDDLKWTWKSLFGHTVRGGIS